MSGIKVSIRTFRCVKSVPDTAIYLLRMVQRHRILRHENILALLDLVPTSPSFPLEEVNCVTEFMDTDLEAVIKSKQDITADHARWFTHQILCGIKFLHEINVVCKDTFTYSKTFSVFDLRI